MKWSIFFKSVLPAMSICKKYRSKTNQMILYWCFFSRISEYWKLAIKDYIWGCTWYQQVWHCLGWVKIWDRIFVRDQFLTQVSGYFAWFQVFKYISCDLWSPHLLITTMQSRVEHVVMIKSGQATQNCFVSAIKKAENIACLFFAWVVFWMIGLFVA